MTRKHEIMTAAGLVDLESPVVTAEVLAHGVLAMARQCRWNGHVVRTVLEHSIQVALQAGQTAYDQKLDRLYRLVVVLKGLVHDWPEGIIGDVVSPMKRLILARLDLVLKVTDYKEDVKEGLRHDIGEVLEGEPLAKALWEFLGKSLGVDRMRWFSLARIVRSIVADADRRALASDWQAFDHEKYGTDRYLFGEPCKMAWQGPDENPVPVFDAKTVIDPTPAYEAWNELFHRTMRELRAEFAKEAKAG